MLHTPLRRSEVVSLLANRRERFGQLGVQSLAIFGSMVRDEAGPDSDVDVLVEFVGPPHSTSTWT